VGAVPEEEFRSIPTPSYELLADAYGRTLRDEPTALHLEDLKFSRKLFDMVKSLTGDVAPARVQADSGTTLLALSDEEWKLAIAEPVGTYQTFLAKQVTENTIDEIFGVDGRQRSDKIDAFRVSYWNALSVQKLKGIFLDIPKCVDMVKRVSEAHALAGQSPREIRMDINNGTVGRRAMVDNMNATTPELKTICSTIFSEFVPSNGEIRLFDWRTVYFTGWTNLDGIWSGELSNIDSGNPAPWEVTLYVNQVGGKIRGELHLFRGDEYARRRFVGDTNNSTLDMTFLYPYQWELGGASPCGGMRAELNSRMSQLTGSWTSTSCTQGGSLNLERGQRSAVRMPDAQANSGCPCS
jgi:hypothetical protein